MGLFGLNHIPKNYEVPISNSQKLRVNLKNAYPSTPSISGKISSSSLLITVKLAKLYKPYNEFAKESIYFPLANYTDTKLNYDLISLEILNEIFKKENLKTIFENKKFWESTSDHLYSLGTKLLSKIFNSGLMNAEHGYQKALENINDSCLLDPDTLMLGNEITSAYGGNKLF